MPLPHHRPQPGTLRKSLPLSTSYRSSPGPGDGPNLDSPHEQKLGISDLHLPFIFPAAIFAFVQISRPRKVCTQTLSGATLLAMGCEASQAVANGLESSYEPGLLLPKIISHTPRKLYFQKCFNRFLCILSLPEHFKHLKNAYIPGKRNRPFPPYSSFRTAPMLNIYCNRLVAVCFSHKLWRAVEKGASPRFTDLSPQPNSDQPSACSGEIQRVLKVNLK